MKLTVMILDVTDLVNAQAPATYRRVTVDLTTEQVAALKLRRMHESYSTSFLELDGEGEGRSSGVFIVGDQPVDPLARPLLERALEALEAEERMSRGFGTAAELRMYRAAADKLRRDLLADLSAYLGKG